MSICVAAILAFLLYLTSSFAPTELIPDGLRAFLDGAVLSFLLYIILHAIWSWRTGVKAPVAKTPAAKAEAVSHGGEALVLLSLLQEKGRFIDFLMEDITPYNDAQVSAASRVVHQGCASVLKEYFEIAPLHGGKEGDKIAVDTAADPNRFRLLGKVVGKPPFKGVVMHRGWKTARLTLPRLSRPVEAAGDNLIAPIEVELK